MDSPSAVFTRSITNTLRAGYPIMMLLLIDWRLALVALAIIPFQSAITWRLQTWLHGATRRQQEIQSGLTTAVKESLDGIETIQALHAGGPAIARMQDWTEQVEAGELRRSRIEALIRANIWFLTSVGLALTWWRGGSGVIAGSMTIGTLIAFTGFVEYAYRPFRHFSNIVKSYRVGAASLERIMELLDLPSAITESPDARPLPITQGDIHFHDVSFDYGKGAVLRHLDLQIEGGKLTAIVGRSGSGKRLDAPAHPQALRPDARRDHDRRPLDVRLHPRVATIPGGRRAATPGDVQRNGPGKHPTGQARRHPRRGRGGVLVRRSTGIHRGPGRRLSGAARTGWLRLSGGQLRRLAIAQALLRRPKILLMDEPTSALDAESERQVVESLGRLRGAMSVVVITHRPSTAAPADRVVLLDTGRIVEAGPPEEILEQVEEGADPSPVTTINESWSRT